MAALEGDHATVHAIDHLAIVRGDDHGGAGAVDALEQLHNAQRNRRVEVARGLVADQQRRTVDHGAGNGNALLLATGKLVGQGVHLIGQADQADVQAFEAELKTWSNVKSVTYKDKDDALAEYTSKMSGNADATMSALDGQNPLPASFAIEMDDPSQVESTAKKLKKNVDFQKIADDGDVNASVLYGQEEVSRLFQVTNYIRIAAVVLVGLLTFIAFIFINNTIRLSITARRREIAIMRLVGASNGFIRGPFITEGVLQAILGSLLSIGVLELLRNLMVPRLQESIGWMSFALPMQYYLVTYAALILVGVLIGLFGSAIAMRRYLRV